MDRLEMNIFVLHGSPILAAQMHCDRHVCKMIIESAQLLAGAHRLLDGKPGKLIDGKSHLVKYSWVLPGEDSQNPTIPLATHINHPCAIWARETSGNYLWLMSLYEALCMEFAYRYSHGHACARWIGRLRELPRAIPVGDMTTHPVCVPADYKAIFGGELDENGNEVVDVVESYRRYYLHDKRSFATWKRRTAPSWFLTGLKSLKVMTI